MDSDVFFLSDSDFRLCSSLLSNIFLLIDSDFDPYHLRKVDLGKCQAKPTSDPGFPALRKAFFQENGFEVFHPSTEDSKQGRGTRCKHQPIYWNSSMRDHLLRTTEQAVREIKREVGIGLTGINPTLGREVGKVPDC